MINLVQNAEDRVSVRRALVSASDKSGLDNLIPGLLEVNPDLVIYSTGGSFSRIAEIIGEGHERNLKQVSEYTGHPEMQGGLVKTLDFKIYLGLLAESFNAAHEHDLHRTHAERFDLVVVNLYPFEQTVSRGDILSEEARGQIDIGGPCMLRAGAKNYLRVATLCNPADYESFLEHLHSNKGTTRIEKRFELARAAFAHTATYDAAISRYLQTLDPAQIAADYTITTRSDV